MSGLREALERLAAEWDERDTPGLALPENQEWAKGVDCGYGAAASELRDLLAAHSVEPAPHNLTHPVGARGVTGIHHADDCPMRNPGTTGCVCGREGEREPS